MVYWSLVSHNGGTTSTRKKKEKRKNNMKKKEKVSEREIGWREIRKHFGQKKLGLSQFDLEKQRDWAITTITFFLCDLAPDFWRF